MKITVEMSDSDLREVCRVTGERKKGPAIRKLVADALLLKRRAEIAQKFINGEGGAEYKDVPDTARHENRKDQANARRWRP